jgi:hypothetical protein
VPDVDWFAASRAVRDNPWCEKVQTGKNAHAAVDAVVATQCTRDCIPLPALRPPTATSKQQREKEKKRNRISKNAVVLLLLLLPWFDTITFYYFTIIIIVVVVVDGGVVGCPTLPESADRVGFAAWNAWSKPLSIGSVHCTCATVATPARRTALVQYAMYTNVAPHGKMDISHLRATKKQAKENKKKQRKRGLATNNSIHPPRHPKKRGRLLPLSFTFVFLFFFIFFLKTVNLGLFHVERVEDERAESSGDENLTKPPSCKWPAKCSARDA